MERALRPEPLPPRAALVELDPGAFGERDEDDASEFAPPAPGPPLGGHATALRTAQQRADLLLELLDLSTQGASSARRSSSVRCEWSLGNW